MKKALALLLIITQSRVVSSSSSSQLDGGTNEHDGGVRLRRSTLANRQTVLPNSRSLHQNDLNKGVHYPSSGSGQLRRRRRNLVALALEEEAEDEYDLDEEYDLNEDYDEEYADDEDEYDYDDEDETNERELKKKKKKQDKKKPNDKKIEKKKDKKEKKKEKAAEKGGAAKGGGGGSNKEVTGLPSKKKKKKAKNKTKEESSMSVGSKSDKGGKMGKSSVSMSMGDEGSKASKKGKGEGGSKAEKGGSKGEKGGSKGSKAKASKCVIQESELPTEESSLSMSMSESMSMSMSESMSMSSMSTSMSSSIIDAMSLSTSLSMSMSESMSASMSMLSTSMSVAADEDKPVIALAGKAGKGEKGSKGGKGEKGSKAEKGSKGGKGSKSVVVCEEDESLSMSMMSASASMSASMSQSLSMSMSMSLSASMSMSTTSSGGAAATTTQATTTPGPLSDAGNDNRDAGGDERDNADDDVSCQINDDGNSNCPQSAPYCCITNPNAGSNDYKCQTTVNNCQVGLASFNTCKGSTQELDCLSDNEECCKFDNGGGDFDFLCITRGTACPPVLAEPIVVVDDTTTTTTTTSTTKATTTPTTTTTTTTKTDPTTTTTTTATTRPPEPIVVPDPSTSPTFSPTKKPTTSPSKSPTELPTKKPTTSPSKSPTELPTKNPTNAPTGSPVVIVPVETEIIIPIAFSVNAPICDLVGSQLTLFKAGAEQAIQAKLPLGQAVITEICNNPVGGVQTQSSRRRLQETPNGWNVEFNVIIKNVLCRARECTAAEDVAKVNGMIETVSSVILESLRDGGFISTLISNPNFQSVIATFGVFGHDPSCLVAWGSVYSATMGDGTEMTTNARAMVAVDPTNQNPFYPDWEGDSGTCLQDGKQALYMTNNPSAWLYNNLESCCKRYFPGTNEPKCLGRSNPQVAGSGKWFVDHSLERCVNDCGVGNAGPTCAGPDVEVPSQQYLFDLPWDCCVQGLSWVFTQYCDAISVHPPNSPTESCYAGTGHFYRSNTRSSVCVRDCDDPSDETCGGVVKASWVRLHDSAETCCSVEYGWVDNELCTLRSTQSTVNKYWPDQSNSKCVKYQNRAPEDLSVPIIDTAELCCATYINWISLSVCVADADGTSALTSGSGKYSIDWEEMKCAKECNGPPPCGGVDTGGNGEVFETADDCCNRLSWVDRNECLLA